CDPDTVASLLLLMMRPPTTSTLFPYTTLFRSVKAILTIILSAVAALINNAATEGGGAVISEQTLKSWGLQLIVSITMYAGLYKPDRKSTRLNSSHVKISYAVFCLKKKNKKNSI